VDWTTEHGDVCTCAADVVRLACTKNDESASGSGPRARRWERPLPPGWRSRRRGLRERI